MNKKLQFWLIVAAIIVIGIFLFSDTKEQNDDQAGALPSNMQESESNGESNESQGGMSPESEQSAQAPTTNELAGRYTSGVLPAASTPGREFSVILQDDMTAIMIGDYKNDVEPEREVGTWSKSDDRITLTLTQRNGYPISGEPLVLHFTVRNTDTLTLVDYDRSRWGTMGLTLTRSSE